MRGGGSISLRAGALARLALRTVVSQSLVRTMLRHAMEAAGYDIAQLGRRWGSSSGTSSANAEIVEALPVARERAHDLVRNFPLARRGKQVLVARLVGDGFTPISKSKEWAALWKRWSPNCYTGGRGNIDRLQSLVVGACIESGAVYGRMRWRRPDDLGWDGLKLAVPMQIQIIEADQVCTDKDGRLDNGGWICGGKEYNPIGQPVAVHFYKEHPSDPWSTGSIESVRVPYSELFHLYEEERPGQVTGMTWFAASGSQMRRLQRYEDAELERKQREACVVGQVKTTGDTYLPTEAPADEDTDGRIGRAVTDVNGNVIETWKTGAFIYPAPGTEVQFSQPSPLAGYSEFTTEHEHRVAMGMGVPVYSLSGKLKDVNFSSARIGDVDTRAWTIPWGEQVFCPLVMDPIALWFTIAAVASGALLGKVEDYYPLDGWQPPTIEEHDRKAAAEADEIELANGLTTLRNRLRARHARDPDDVLTEAQKERKDIVKRGLNFRFMESKSKQPETAPSENQK